VQIVATIIWLAAGLALIAFAEEPPPLDEDEKTRIAPTARSKPATPRNA
jgi:hypothetical protein